MDLYSVPASKDDTLPLAHERWLIEKAREGDETATWDLLYQYRGALQAAARRVRTSARGLTPEQIEDLESNLIVTAIEVIKEKFDPARYERLSFVLPKYLQETATQTISALTIPRSVLGRWFKILRLADNDMDQAARIAPDHGLSVNSFRAIANALRCSDSDWLAEHFDPFKISPDVETQRLAYIALGVLSPTQRTVVEYAYGFRGDPSPDAEIGDILMMPRRTAQTHRRNALIAMRAALHAEVEQVNRDYETRLSEKGGK